MIINLKRVSENAKIPTRANEGDAGYDLYAVEDVWIKPGQRRLVDTGIKVAIPLGYYGRIAPRSGLAVKYGIDVLAGVVDSTYRGVVKVVLINLADGDETQSFKVTAGDRIAQLIIEKCHGAHFNEVENDLDETPRGIGGFGSTGGITVNG